MAKITQLGGVSDRTVPDVAGRDVVEGARGETVAGSGEDEAPSRPSHNAPKADWVAYAEAVGVEDVDDVSKATLIELVSELADTETG